MFIINLYGWIGNTLLLSGVLLLTKKNKLGFFLNTAGNAVYAIQAILHNNVPLLWLSILLAVINIYGIYNWPKVVK